MIRFWFRSLAACLLGMVLVSPVLLTGCKSETTVVNPQEPSDYRDWEQATHRPHVDFEKRGPDEQRQYNDWHASRDHH